MERMRKGRAKTSKAKDSLAGIPIESSGPVVNSPKRRRPQAPKSLQARLENLHHLLGVSSFARWPLQLKFFAPDVFKKWEDCAANSGVRLRRNIKIELVRPNLEQITPVSDIQVSKIPEPIRTIAVGYEDRKAHIEKARSIFGDGAFPSCEICRGVLDPSKVLVLVCPIEGCRSVSHLACLARLFLRQDQDINAIIPMKGNCPGCDSNIEWHVLVKELSLRTRGQKEVEALFKARKRKGKTSHVNEEAAAATSTTLQEYEHDGTDTEDDGWVFQVDDAEGNISPHEDALSDSSGIWSD